MKALDGSAILWPLWIIPEETWITLSINSILFGLRQLFLVGLFLPGFFPRAGDREGQSGMLDVYE